MIEIGDAVREAAPDLQRPSGGFAWWYADLVSPEGDGAVLIWSYGLPFLPGNAAAARHGRPERPAARPSVNVVAYRRGRPTVYLLQEYPEREADGVGHGPMQRIGRCRFDRQTQAGGLHLHAELDCPMPGTDERLTGTLWIQGVARGADPAACSGDGVPHLWTPLSGPARGEAILRLGSRVVASVRGRAYHDRNTGGVPLHALGMDRWMWGRFPFADRERIAYLLWPEGGAPPRAIGLEIGADGATEHVGPLAVHAEGERWSPIGPRPPATVRLLHGGQPWLVLRPRAPGDVGPFYLRFLCDAEAANGARATGWAETVRPNRIDRVLHRPFVRMRVHRAAGANSPWVPLFSGPREGRAGRLLRHLLGRQR